MNLLISAHIQLVHIWILYVCFLSLRSHRPIDIFLIWEIIVNGSFFFFFLWKIFNKNGNVCRPSIQKKKVIYLVSIPMPLPVLSFTLLPNFLLFEPSIIFISWSVLTTPFLCLSTSRLIFNPLHCRSSISMTFTIELLPLSMVIEKGYRKTNSSYHGVPSV